MPDSGRKRVYRATLIYCLLLLYILAALIWWFISLNVQNNRMKELNTKDLQYRVGTGNPELYTIELNKIISEHKKNRSKYIGEGSIFFLLIMVGAVFVYGSVKRQFNVQQQQQNFMMAVTHELKTPVSVAKLNLETLQKYNLDEEKQKKLLKNTLDETSRLTFLTNNILIASQLESGNKISREDLDFSDLVRDCITDARTRFTERIFMENIEPDVDVKGDPLLLQLMVNNLLENAVKYSPRESPVILSLKRSKSNVEMQVKDEGPGIPDAEKKKIFSKFYRIGNEATRKAQGTGLGLYICRKISKDHNADISVTDNTPHGSIFTLVFKT